MKNKKQSRYLQKKESESGKQLDNLLQQLEKTKSLSKQSELIREIVRLTAKRKNHEYSRTQKPKQKIKKIVRKKIKPIKKRKQTRPKYKRGKLSFQKIRGKNIFDLVFKRGQNTLKEVEQKLNEINFLGFNKGELPDEFVKVTWIFKKSKDEHAAISYIYPGLESTSDLYDAIMDMRAEIFTKRYAPKKHAKTYAKVLMYKNYLHRIIVDFDTAT